MKPYRTLMALAISTIMTLSQAVCVTAQGTTPLNLSQGKINGEKLEYTIFLPTFWSGYLFAERETNKAGDAVLEKIVFYYMPQDSKIEPVFLMDFYVGNRRIWKDSTDIRKIFETEDFVFAHRYATENTLENKTDNALFARFLGEAANSEYFGSFIRLPDSQRIILSNTVSVNGKTLKVKAVASEGGGLFVPLRETCIEMGYDVGWLDKEKAVTVSRSPGGKQNFYYMIMSVPSIVGHGFCITIIDGRAYVPPLFFTQILNANVEIDENYNVFITFHGN